MVNRIFVVSVTLGLCLAAGILGPILFTKHHRQSLDHSIALAGAPTTTLPMCERNPFIQYLNVGDFNLYENWAFHQRLSTQRIIEELQNEPRANWEKLIPVIPNSCTGHLTRIGGRDLIASLTGWPRDGSKLICGFEQMDDSHHCLVFSLGSHGDWTFEEEMLETKKNCRTVTFDCTGDFAPPTHIADRATFHKTCYGLDPARGPQFRGMEEMMKESQVSRISFLKMDIEMAEWEYFEDMFKNFDPKNSTHLPDQIVVELHWPDNYNGVPVDVNRLGALVDGWYDVGYRIVEREINLAGTCPECYEVTLVRFRC